MPRDWSHNILPVQHFTRMARLFGEVRTLYIDIKGHLVDLLEHCTVWIGFSPE